MSRAIAECDKTSVRSVSMLNELKSRKGALEVLESVFKYFLRLCKSFFQVKVCQMLLRLEKKVLFSFQFRKNVSFCQKIGVCLARGHLSSGRRNDDVVVRFVVNYSDHSKMQKLNELHFRGISSTSNKKECPQNDFF